MYVCMGYWVGWAEVSRRQLGTITSITIVEGDMVCVRACAETDRNSRYTAVGKQISIVGRKSQFDMWPRTVLHCHWRWEMAMLLHEHVASRDIMQMYIHINTHTYIHNM